MLPIKITPETTALIIVDLQKGYCDPKGDAAKALGWNCRAMDQVCKRHVPFVEQIRGILPPAHIIWARMEENQDTIAENTSMKYDTDFIPLCVKGTAGHDYHVVQPKDGETEVSRVHPSAFHRSSKITTVGYSCEGNPAWMCANLLARSLFTSGIINPIRSVSLDNALKMMRIQTVAVTGVLESRNVGATACGASIFGYNCIILSDLVGMSRGRAFDIEAQANRPWRDMFLTHNITSDAFINALKR